jgi:hypothetical protein
MELQNLRDALVRFEIADADAVLKIDPLPPERLARRQFAGALDPFR